MITVKGTGLANVNALSLALPYDSGEYEFVGIESLEVAGMSNYSKNRLHSNGNTAVYPTFVNEGNRATLNGDVEIAKVTLKAKKNIKKFNISAVDGVIVDKHMNSIKF